MTGASFEDFFKRYIAGAEPLPYQTTFALAGLELREVQHKHATLGFQAAPVAGATLAVSSVDADGTAAAAGLQPDDVIVKWNGSDPPRHTNNWIRDQKAGGTLPT